MVTETVITLRGVAGTVISGFQIQDSSTHDLLRIAESSDKPPHPPTPLPQGGEGRNEPSLYPRPLGGEGGAQRQVRGLVRHDIM
ncbi:hypothetical protein SBA2_210013 [Acidobacteriia bacterium SbA2]|nr:hypothetical protein SBA2_210013 [Acidobacteriia bacterium SbA2]